ncbi:tetratricopeptide repeat protein [Sabulilitoribacter arenilitoris]|uniref:Tetratricopeptide repeat protein n=1 Tax=Wocania arenilitoris TaxID=2044858 RepID=A0AAE3JKQ6_9FLAO|nr:tetratricopeptide repeat protein [Wocania arenilitoris]MCF7567337.1 tetratricopeptide repeat protein [Wocania arenilitoris]
MKNLVIFILSLFTVCSFSQEKEQLLAQKNANNFVYEGNALVNEDDFVSAEMAYRKAISEQPTSIAGIYNLGNSYYKKGNYEEALYRHQQAIKNAGSKTEKHKTFHNIGNVLMQNKKCKEAVEAYKNALRNNPSDDETRYNLGLAKECAEQQKDQEDQDKNDENKDNKDDKKDQDKKENEDKKEKEGDDKEEKKDEGDKDKKEGDDKKDDEGKPKDEKEDKGKGEDDKKKEQQKPKPQPGQLSPQQIKSLLEAMNNQEKKVQEKMNAEKQKGIKIKTEKDW